MRVYLAGPINGCDDGQAKDWRAWVGQKLPDHTMVDPMVRDYRGVEDIEYVNIVELDKADIDSCDVVLANCWQPSWGTAMELHYAHTVQVPIYVVVPAGMRVSPWLRYHAEVVSTLEEGVEAVSASPGDQEWPARARMGDEPTISRGAF